MLELFVKENPGGPSEEIKIVVIQVISLRNILIVALILLVGWLPSQFPDQGKVNWWLFWDDPSSPYWSAYFYSERINFVLMAALIFYNTKDKVSRIVFRILLFICLFDLIHLILVKRAVFDWVKLSTATLLSGFIDFYKWYKNRGDD